MGDPRDLLQPQWRCFQETWNKELIIKIFRYAGLEARYHATQVCYAFNNVIQSGRLNGDFDVKGGSIAAGSSHAVICTFNGRVSVSKFD